MSRNRRGFSLLEVMMVVVILGILARIAIPSLLKYTKRSKASEAIMSVRKLYDSSASYFSTEHYDSDANLVLAQFPGTTPTRPACCVGATKTVIADWDDIDTWTALNFGISDPFYYSYQYDSNGVEEAAQFTASAFGDLDEDGEASTFVRFGTIAEWEVRGAPGLYANRPLE